MSCGGTIHLTSIDVILLSSPKVHIYTWILLQLFDSYYPDKWTHESNELVIKRHWSTREHTWFTYTFWIWTSSRSLILLIEEQWYIPCINFVLYVSVFVLSCWDINSIIWALSYTLMLEYNILIQAYKYISNIHNHSVSHY